MIAVGPIGQAESISEQIMPIDEYDRTTKTITCDIKNTTYKTKSPAGGYGWRVAGRRYCDRSTSGDVTKSDEPRVTALPMAASPSENSIGWSYFDISLLTDNYCVVYS